MQAILTREKCIEALKCGTFMFACLPKTEKTEMD